MSEHYDVVIVGGAAIGSATAYHLAATRGYRGKVLVLEKDPTYRLSASALSAASIRQQFSSAVNIRISLYGIDFIRNLDTHLGLAGEVAHAGLHEGGYLYLASPDGADILKQNQRLQTKEGADILLLDPAELAARFPWLSLENIACGTFGRTGEGWFDGWGLLQAFRKKARALGVEYRAGEVATYERSGDKVTAVRLSSGEIILANWFVNAAGTYGASLAATAGISIPVRAKKRYVFTFTSKSDVSGFPLLIDTSGVYCRPEGKTGSDGQLFICGASPPASADPDWDETDPGVEDVDWSFFEERIWPALANRVPAFEAIRPGRAWAGPYDMNLMDANAILGPAVGCPNLLLANGFSGHGLQQAPAVGRGLAEWIVQQKWASLDLSDLGHARILANAPLKEANII
jgi:FAD-dependent oxidoreductase domain-containing protein 1